MQNLEISTESCKARTIITALLALFTITVQAQTTVKGQVVNERGESIEYVSIGIEGDSVGVISDAQGHFTLTIPAGRRDEQAFTHVSYQTATIPYATYADGRELTVTLKDKVIELAEVVVGKKNKSHTLSGKSWIRTSTAGFEGDCKGEIKGRLVFPANFKSSYARHKVKGKMRKIPGCPMIVVKGYEVE